MGLFSSIKEDFASVANRDPANDSKIELFFNYPGLWAIFWYRIAHWLYLKNFQIFAKVIMSTQQLFTNIDINPACNIGRRVFIDHGIGVVIGGTAIVGDDVTIYQGSTLGGVSLDKGKRHPTIANGVTIGAGAKVLGNILIGENSKIGANSVVIKDVPSNCTAVGVPARIITKEQDITPLNHNKLPNISNELFAYLIERIKVLESVLENENPEIKIKNINLQGEYYEFLKSVETLNNL